MFPMPVLVVVSLVLLTVVESFEDCANQGLAGHYWSQEDQKCIPCTRCHDARLITLLGCGPDRDTRCGTIEDFRNHWLLDSLINGEDISKRASVNVLSSSKTQKDTEEIFGETRYSPRGSSPQRWDATQQVKEKVNNDAVKKSEFLKKLQELEQLEVRKKSKQEQEEVDGLIHFTENQFYKEEDSEHKNLQIIQKELLKEKEISEQMTTIRTTVIQSSQNENSPKQKSTNLPISTRKKPVPTPPQITEWFNGNAGIMETISTPSTIDKKEDDDFAIGEKHFFATGSYVNNDPDVFGQVIEEPHANVRVSHYPSDEFGILTQLLHRQSAQNTDSVQNPSTSTMEDPNVISLKMEHVLVVLGFCIGFGLVVCVAIVYFKFKPVRSFKMLTNASARVPDNASLSSGNSSFQQTDSRLTSLTASPLLSQAQSPLLPMQVPTSSRMASPMQPSRLASPLQPTRLATSPREDKNLLNLPDARPMAIVDQRGRTVLKQSRELPV